ncbi:hypothetical protein FHS83_000964 [Rhizomicrobium palustre]|uniref:Uncharacterized protein n=1 Tax=Rhizomicrobium palustre TaxID=189966 RepID=A0A846MW79_9PROT|nr:hypothetical protein [Rhizomicrobium palustre]NIK87646.1 hypothetical protein [Rhizomicrobium palustre]
MRGEDGERQEQVRRLIALTLMGALLALLIYVMVMAAVALLPHPPDPALLAAIRTKEDAERAAALLKLSAQSAKDDAEALAALFNIVFGPLMALLGSVTGFYFGRRG